MEGTCEGASIASQTCGKVSTDEEGRNTLESYIRRRVQFNEVERLSEDSLSEEDSMAIGWVSEIFPLLAASRHIALENDGCCTTYIMASMVNTTIFQLVSV